jgi:hypothetical protein
VGRSWETDQCGWSSSVIWILKAIPYRNVKKKSIYILFIHKFFHYSSLLY